MNVFDTENRLFKTVEEAACFFANQAKSLEADTSMAQVYQASCETAEMLLRLHALENPSSGQ